MGIFDKIKEFFGFNKSKKENNVYKNKIDDIEFNSDFDLNSEDSKIIKDIIKKDKNQKIENKKEKEGVSEKEYDLILIAKRFEKLYNKSNDLSKLEKAIENYVKLVSMNSLTPIPYERLAIIYHRQKNYNGELAILNRAIELDIKFKNRDQRLKKLKKLI